MVTVKETSAGVGVQPRDAPAQNPAISITEARKSFRHGLWPARRAIEVLRGASMVARPGELVGLVGELQAVWEA